MEKLLTRLIELIELKTSMLMMNEVKNYESVKKEIESTIDIILKKYHFSRL
jgi:hypothetical protein